VLRAEACNTDTTPTQPHRNSNTHQTKNNTTNVVIQQNSRRLLMMDILMSETCSAHKKWNKITSDIKLVFYSSTGPVYLQCAGDNISNSILHQLVIIDFDTIWYTLCRKVIDRPEYQNSKFYAPGALSYCYKKTAMSCCFIFDKKTLS